MHKRFILVLTILLSILVAFPAQASELPDRYTETIATESGDEISFEMKLIPGTGFLMGSSAGEEGRDEDEGPRVEVRLSPYYLATKETTLELFLAYYRETHTTGDDYFPSDNSQEVDTITGPTPVYGDLSMGNGEQHPAIGMTWKNAGMFCRWLSAKTGREYRLPTEAEWENACRGGTDHVFGYGDDAEPLTDYAWFSTGPSSGTREVGRKQPNSFGLFDMQGNVCEWVQDFYLPEGYLEAAQTNPVQDPRGPGEGKVHVARGGHYRSPAKELRCAARDFEKRWWRSGDPQLPKSSWWLPDMDHIGFRVARSADSEN